MRQTVPTELESGRVREGPGRSDPSFGFCGFFCIRIKGTKIKVMSSDGSDWKEAKLSGEPWEHVSVSCQHRCPSWNEMSFIKNLCWDPEETVIQFHPPASSYVNVHPYCLHLWRPMETSIPLPPLGTL